MIRKQQNNNITAVKTEPFKLRKVMLNPNNANPLQFRNSNPSSSPRPKPIRKPLKNRNIKKNRQNFRRTLAFNNQSQKRQAQIKNVRSVRSQNSNTNLNMEEKSKKLSKFNAPYISIPVQPPVPPLPRPHKRQAQIKNVRSVRSQNSNTNLNMEEKSKKLSKFNAPYISIPAPPPAPPRPRPKSKRSSMSNARVTPIPSTSNPTNGGTTIPQNSTNIEQLAQQLARYINSDPNFLNELINILTNNSKNKFIQLKRKRQKIGSSSQNMKALKNLLRSLPSNVVYNVKTKAGIKRTANVNQNQSKLQKIRATPMEIENTVPLASPMVNAEQLATFINMDQLKLFMEINSSLDQIERAIDRFNYKTLIMLP